MKDVLNIRANRSAVKWTPREQLMRVLWALVYPLFRCSPRNLWNWRAGLLRLFGASVGSDVHIYPTVSIALPWNLAIGDSAAVGDWQFSTTSVASPSGRVRPCPLWRTFVLARMIIGAQIFLCLIVDIDRRRRLGLFGCLYRPGRDCRGAQPSSARGLWQFATLNLLHIVAGNPALTVGKRDRPVPV